MRPASFLFFREWYYVDTERERNPPDLPPNMYSFIRLKSDF